MASAFVAVAFCCVKHGRVINRAMSWWPESGLLRTVLEAKSSAYACVALACGAIIALAALEVRYLSALPLVVLGIAGAVGLVTFGLFLGRMWDLTSGSWRERRRRRAVLACLDRLSTSEEALLRHQVEKNDQSFSISLSSSVAAGLRRKGLLEVSSVVGDFLGYPHTIPDFVWRELRRRGEIEEKAEARSGSAGSSPTRARRAQRG